MELKIIYGEEATMEDLMELYEKRGIAITINDGHVSGVFQEAFDGE